MCGFAGFVGFRKDYSNRQDRLSLLGEMAKPLSRRGPDDETLYDDDSLSFVFRRLSIVDLQSGKQPIWNEDETVFVAINGEIYNHLDLRSFLKKDHKFRTRSDSEVVLHLYEEMGIRCLDLLVGMFAIVIWDSRKKELFLARDRMGIKPLYYSQTAQGLLFGSELKALLVVPQCPREMDWEMLRIGFPTLGGYQNGRVSTHVHGIEFLPGGSYAIVDASGILTEKKYWSIEKFFSKPGESSRILSSYVSEYSHLIEDSIHKRLMSDVPIGSFLSGGLDSSLITAVASRKNRSLHCFHALEQTTLRCGDTAAAERVARDNGVPLHPVLFDGNKFLKSINFNLETFEYFIWMMDSPRFDLEWLFKHELHRYAKTVVPDLKVMLLGQGSDEFAGGYSNTNRAQKDWKSFLSYDLKRDAQWSFFQENQIPIQMRDDFSPDFGLKVDSPESNFQQMAVGRVFLLQAFNLWHEDRTSSAQGIESRLPFLDHRLVEFLVSIPVDMHPQLFWDKNIVRLAGQSWLPNELTRRPKVGFFQTGDENSIWDLKREILNRTYRDFKEKYLVKGNAIFLPPRFESLFSTAQAEDASSWKSIDELIGLMALTCFYENCQGRSQSSTQRFLNAMTVPSPLKELSKEAAQKRWKISELEIQKSTSQEPPIRWRDEDCPVLVNGLKAWLFLPHSLHIAVPSKDEVIVELELKTLWIFDLLKLLSEKNYAAQNFIQLSKKMKLPLLTLKAAVRMLAKMGIFCAYKKEIVQKRKAPRQNRAA